MIIKEKFRHSDSTGFNYHWEGDIKNGDSVLLAFPPVTANKRGINDIGWMIDGNAKLYATTSNKPLTDSDSLWQEVDEFDDINKCATGVKIVGSGGVSHALVRIILN